MFSRYIDKFDYSSRFRILKGGKISLVVSAILGSAIIASAAPTGGVVVSGNTTISQNGNVTNINQTTNKSIINWQNFNVAGNETVNFNMPNSSSTSLNRIIGNEASSIYGVINSNGQVFLVNQNGIYFGKDSQVNTAGFVASTKDIKNEDFLNGKYQFEGDSNASIINLGTITTNNAYTALLAKKVENEGVIKAHLGQVHLVSGDKFTLDINGNSLLKLTIDKGIIDGLVSNKGAVIADGGEIYLTTSALDEVLSGLVNNTGIIQANSVEEKDGKIILFAHGGTGEFGGTIESKGGFVETSGKEFKNKADLKVKADKWLIDPVNITIDSTLANTIQTALGSGDVMITTDTGASDVDTSSNESGTDGDIFVNSAISWSSENDLWLVADRNIYINSAITANDDNGKLYLYYGQGEAPSGNTANYYVNAPINLQSGQNFTTNLGENGSDVNYIVINGTNAEIITALQDINTNQTTLAGNYALGLNVDLSSITNWTPIGYGYNFGQAFTGRFDGLGHIVSNLTINRDTQFAGFFGAIRDNTFNPEIKNLGIETGTVTATGQTEVGALVGNMTGSLSNVYAKNVTVSGGEYVGGLVGYSYATIQNSYATGNNVTATNWRGSAGGLVGYSNGDISNSYATGTVTGATKVGGLVGYNLGKKIENSYATATVIATDTDGTAGGLVGENSSNGSDIGTILNSYATGSVTASSGVAGGLVGKNGEVADPFMCEIMGMCDPRPADITNSYAIGAVSGTTKGGLVGVNNAGNISGFYNSTVNSSGMSDSSYGRTTEQFANSSTFNGWGTNVWSLGGADSSVAGYQVGISRPYLTTLGKDAEITSATLFSDGLGSSNNPYTITNWTQLQNINNSNILTQNYYFKLLNNLSSSTSDYTNLASSTANSGAGWNPIGGLFTGNFNGNDYTISNLYINRPSRAFVGLFGRLNNNSTITNVGVLNANVTGDYYVGILSGDTRANSTVQYSYSSGTVHANNIIIGGLVGESYGTISNSYSTANVTGGGYVGGLIGGNHGFVSNSYSTDVNNPLLAINDGGTDSNVFWLTSDNNSVYSGIGSSQLTNAEFKKSSIFSNADWIIATDSTLSTSLTAPVLVTKNGVTSWVMPVYTTYLNYALSTISSGYTYSGNAVTLNSLWSASSIFGSSYSSWEYGTDYSFIYGGNAITGFTNAGTYSGIDIDILKSGYTEASSGNTLGSFKINQKELTASLTGTISKVYNGNQAATLSSSNYSVSGFVENEGATVTETSATYNSKDVASAETATATLEANDFSANQGTTLSNYVLPTTANGAATITKAKLIVTANDDSIVEGSKVYNGGKGVIYDGLVANEKEEVLNGALTYEGTSQGAKNVGDYVIAPKGLTSNNYDISYNNGKLIITPDTTKIVSNALPKNNDTTGTNDTTDNKLPVTTTDNAPKNTGDTLEEVVTKGGNINPFETKPTVAELKEKGTPVVELKTQGYQAVELKNGGYSAKELKDAGYSIAELKDAGYSADELKAAGFSSLQLKKAGF